MTEIPYTLTINRQCSRCPREDRAEITVEDAVRLAKDKLRQPKALVLKFDETDTVEFQFLCTTCRTIVKRYVESLGRKLEKHSALREKQTIEVEQD